MINLRAFSPNFSSKHSPGKMAPTLPHIEGEHETLEIILLKVFYSLGRRMLLGMVEFDPGPHLKCSLDQSY